MAQKSILYKLKEEMINEADYMSQKAHNIATDMEFLKQLSQPANYLNRFKSTRLNNVGGLAQLLKIKNARFNFSQQTRQNGQQWIKKKGGDVNPLISKIQQTKKQVKIKDQKIKAESECYFYMSRIGFDNQDEYLEKNFEFGVLKTIQSIMTEQMNKGSIAKRVLKRRNLSRFNKQKSPADGLPVINLQIRNPDKKSEYLRQTYEIIKSIDHLKGNQWAQKYSIVTKKQFWDIFSYQISAVIAEKNRANWISALALASLQLVQKQLDSELPPLYDDILIFLTNHYLGKMRGQYDSEGSFGPIWGVRLMLYRAGRRKDLYLSVQDQKLKKSFQQVDQSIRQKQPIKLPAIEETGDLFYNQLTYALRGVPKCSTQALCSPHNLDIVWVFLRNVGIFTSPEDNSIFLNLRKQLFESYKGPLMTQKKIKNLLYLFSYSEIVEIGPNQIMDQDDYLHFMIALYHSLVFDVLPKDKKQFVENKLTEELVHYIHQLLLEKKEDYLNYMLLIPKARMLEEISSIVASSHLLETIKWGYLKEKLDKELFTKLVHVTLHKYVAFHQDYIQVAQKQCELLDDYRAALNFILQLFIRSVLYTKVNSSDLKRAEIFASDILSRDYSLRLQYEAVFAFFKENRELVELIQQRNEFRIYEYIQQCNFILISEQLPNQLRQCLSKLLQNKGFQCYIHYLRNLTKAEQISLLRLNRQQQFLQVNLLTLNALVGLMKNQPFTEYLSTENVKTLISMLQQTYYDQY